MSDQIILSIDVGGTKLDYIFSELHASHNTIQEGRIYCSTFLSFHDALHWLFEQIATPVNHVFIAAAGPVQNGCISFTNLDWHIDSKKIIKNFGLKRLILVNDLTAVMWSLQSLTDRDFTPIRFGEPQGNTSLVVAPGTGLGVGIGVQSPAGLVCLPSEGGHVSFSPRNQLELDLLQFLFDDDHISAESVCSGIGLGNLFRFLAKDKPCAENLDYQTLGPWLQLQIEMKSEYADLAMQTYSLFFDILAEVCGNLAVTCLPTSGIYLTGGLMSKLASHMSRESFIERFLDRSVQDELLRSIPISQITHQNSALVGCQNLMMMDMRGIK